jgi:hypothetical protein
MKCEGDANYSQLKKYCKQDKNLYRVVRLETEKGKRFEWPNNTNFSFSLIIKHHKFLFNSENWKAFQKTHTL